MFLKIKNVESQNPEDDEKYKTCTLEKYFCNIKKFGKSLEQLLSSMLHRNRQIEMITLFYPSTVYNYFGMAKERIRLIFPDNNIWPGHE